MLGTVGALTAKHPTNTATNSTVYEHSLAIITRQSRKGRYGSPRQAMGHIHATNPRITTKHDWHLWVRNPTCHTQPILLAPSLNRKTRLLSNNLTSRRRPITHNAGPKTTYQLHITHGSQKKDIRLHNREPIR